jgi:transposase
MFVDELELLQKQLSEIEEDIKAIVEQMPESRILQSVRGIGIITAAYLLSEIIDFKAYKVIREIEKFAGVNIYEISSGKHKGKRKLSKRGRTLLRKTLYMAALNMIKKDGIYHKDYQRYLARGKKKVEALVIVMKRLLRMVFALLRKDEMFIENYKLAA